MHANERLVERFYIAMNGRDADAIAASYADDATFEDPAFGRLTAAETRAMWRMLLDRATDLRVEFADIHADDRTGSVHWEAYYRFGGNPVHNVIDADFEFRDGLIVRHVDSFDWPRWATQALGLPGRLLGRSRLLHKLTMRKARKQLDAYLAQQGED